MISNFLALVDQVSFIIENIPILVSDNIALLQHILRNLAHFIIVHLVSIRQDYPLLRLPLAQSALSARGLIVLNLSLFR